MNRRACSALLAAACAVLCACSPAAKPVRVVLITLDTLRHDRFVSAMPLVAARAARGLVFDQFYSATSSTQPTHATILTGIEPWRHGVSRNGAVLEPRFETLAERLQGAGFSTSAVVASFPLEHRFGFAQGFDVYDDGFELNVGGEGQPKRVWSGAQVEDEFYSLADSITRKAIAQIDAAHGERQFFWFHYFDPHPPYGDSAGSGLDFHTLWAAATDRSPQLPALLDQARAGYDADVRALDGALERVLARLARDEPNVETHILVTADHGEAFGEQGELGHGKALNRAQVHVPTFLLSPRVAPGVRTDTAGSIDILPTLLACSHVAAGTRSAGRDLAAAPRAEAIALGMRRTYLKPIKDVHTDGSFVMIDGPQFYFVRSGRLYTGNARGIESEDAAPDAALVSHAKELFAAFEAELARGESREDLAPETQRALEALGYTR